jgi:hypothetical protein
MPLNKDLREFIGLLNSHGVEYVVVGGFAMAFHGVPRYTGDIDFLVRVSPANAARIEAVLRDFGFASSGLSAHDFLEPDRVVQLGYPPYRIDLLTSITGVPFDDVWASRIPADLDGLPVAFISKPALIRNKRATGRSQDNADIEMLENG